MVAELIKPMDPPKWCQFIRDTYGADAHGHGSQGASSSSGHGHRPHSRSPRGSCPSAELAQEREARIAIEGRAAALEVELDRVRRLAEADFATLQDQLAMERGRTDQANHAALAWKQSAEQVETDARAHRAFRAQISEDSTRDMAALYEFFGAVHEKNWPMANTLVHTRPRLACRIMDSGPTKGSSCGETHNPLQRSPRTHTQQQCVIHSKPFTRFACIS